MMIMGVARTAITEVGLGSYVPGALCTQEVGGTKMKHCFLEAGAGEVPPPTLEKTGGSHRKTAALQSSIVTRSTSCWIPRVLFKR